MESSTVLRALDFGFELGARYAEARVRLNNVKKDFMDNVDSKRDTPEYEEALDDFWKRHSDIYDQASERLQNL